MVDILENICINYLKHLHVSSSFSASSVSGLQKSTSAKLPLKKSNKFAAQNFITLLNKIYIHTALTYYYSNTSIHISGHHLAPIILNTKSPYPAQKPTYFHHGKATSNTDPVQRSALAQPSSPVKSPSKIALLWLLFDLCNSTRRSLHLLAKRQHKRPRRRVG